MLHNIFDWGNHICVFTHIDNHGIHWNFYFIAPTWGYPHSVPGSGFQTRKHVGGTRAWPTTSCSRGSGVRGRPCQLGCPGRLCEPSVVAQPVAEVWMPRVMRSGTCHSVITQTSGYRGLKAWQQTMAGNQTLTDDGHINTIPDLRCF